MSNKVIYFARDLLEKGEDFVIARVAETKGSTPRKSGALMLMRSDGTFSGTVGGGRIEAETEKLCRETIKTKEKRRTYHFKLNTTEEDALDMGCGGDADITIEYIDAGDPGRFLEEFRINDTAYIFGAGHVGLALEPVLRHINFSTVVIDDRKEYSNRERFPEATDVRTIKSFEHSFDDIACDVNSYIIIVTRGHMGDYDVLRHALKQERAYIGMIGSRKKNQIIRDMLKEKDGFTDAEIDQVYAPIGENIYAETPEEIAVSIAAELIRVRTGHGSR
ncbi:MAG: dehydrogenase [Clostridiales bacterium]|nr:dehydrogenase [Clostridiales bacterium]